MYKRILAVVLMLVAIASLSVHFVAAQDEQALVVWTDEARAPVIEALGEAFTAEYGIPLTVTQMGFGDIRDQLIIAGPAGEGPDVLIGAHDWLGQLTADNLIAPIELDPDLTAEFLPAALQAFTYDNVLYGVPYAVENVALFRNTDLVPDAPATWDEVRSISQELETSGASQYGFIMQRGDPYHFFGLQTAFGGYVFGQDENGNYLASDVGIDSAGSVAALQWASDMVTDGIMPNATGDEAKALFESGDAAMWITGPWNLQEFRDAGIPYAISDIPAGPDGTPGRPFMGVQGFMVNSNSHNVDLATAFLTEFVATQDTMVALQEVGTRPSAFLSAAATLTDPDFVAFAHAGANALPMPSIPQMSSVWGAWQGGIDLVFNGDSTAQDAFTQSASDIRTAIEATPTPAP